MISTLTQTREWCQEAEELWNALKPHLSKLGFCTDNVLELHMDGNEISAVYYISAEQKEAQEILEQVKDILKEAKDDIQQN